MTPQTEVPNDQTMADVAKATSTAQAASPAATPKPGYKSSEFTATVASAIALGSGVVPAHYQPLVAAMVGVYVACRTLLKVVHALGYAKALPDLPDVPTGVVK